MNDIIGWKVFGDLKQQPQKAEGQPCFASTHQLSGSDILEKLYDVIVCRINNPKENNLKGTLKALKFCSGPEETCFLIVKRDCVLNSCEAQDE